MASVYFHLWWFMLIVYVTCAVSPAIPKPAHKARVADRPLSEKSHFDGDENVHNMEYDHDAFLGHEEAKKFDDITPSESKERLGMLFIKIDRNSDGRLSDDELQTWMKHVQSKDVWDETNQQWKELNPVHQDSLSWEEYEKHSYGNDNNEDNADLIARDKRRWSLADANNDELLSHEEFHNFIHPEQANHMKDLIIEETLEEVDTNHDGLISFDEYMSDAVGDEDEDENGDDSWIKEEEEEFRTDLDKNGDGILDHEEIALWLVPDDYDHIIEETKHLFSEADRDKDGFLSADEVINNYELFVGSQVTSYGELFDRDEL